MPSALAHIVLQGGMVHIAIVTISDRASRSAYEDLGGPAVEEWLRRAIVTPCSYTRRTIPDGLEVVRDVLIDLCDRTGVELIMTTGGSGPSPRDLTPEAMRAVVTKELPGFGELMRRISLNRFRLPSSHARLQASAADP